jgi:hypothetical protein
MWREYGVGKWHLNFATHLLFEMLSYANVSTPGGTRSGSFQRLIGKLTGIAPTGAHMESR